MTDFAPPPLTITLNGELKRLASLADFRAEHQLPDVFGVAFFEPEGIEYHPIWSRQAVLQAVGEVLHTAVPHTIPLAQLNQLPQMLALIFQNEIITRGTDGDLLRDDVEQVATDLQNILEPAAYKLIELYYQNGQDKTAVAEKFDMPAIYQEVLDSTVQLSYKAEGYPARPEWEIDVIYSVYGPIGLQVNTAVDTHALEDRTLAFPALDFIAATGLALGRVLCDGFTH